MSISFLLIHVNFCKQHCRVKRNTYSIKYCLLDKKIF